MWKCLPIVCFVGLVALALPTRDEYNVEPVHIIKPPIRCPPGMKPDANGRCREVWRRVDDVCPEGEQPDEDGLCLEIEKSPECDGEECTGKKVEKRDVTEAQTEAFKPIKKQRRMESLKNEKKSKKRSYADDGKQARSKHAWLMMLKKKKMQMMKPKPPPPPPHHHHPPPPPPEEEPEEEPATEEPPADDPARLFFADEICLEAENTTGGCQPDVEVVEKAPEKNEFKEWKPDKETESSDTSSSSSSSSSSASSSSSSSADSTGESESETESEGGSGESEDEVLEKAIKIKLMKIFRMKQMYGPALRRWLVAQLREYEDSLDY